MSEENNTPGTGDNGNEDVSGLKNALAEERKARKAAERDVKEARDALSDVQGRLDKLETDGKSEQERAIESARKEAAEEARKDERSKWAGTLRAAKAEVLAAGKLANPKLATRLIDLSEIEVNEDGAVDEGAISKAIDSLLESDPYLGTNGSSKPSGSADGGVRPPSKPEPTPGIGRLQQAYADSSKT